MSSYTRIQLEEWLKTIEIVDGYVLDVGGSQQGVVKRLKDTAIWSKNYAVLDLEEPHQKKEKVDLVCDLNHPEKGIKVNNPDFIGDTGKNFDNVFCLEVMEYIWNSVAALKMINYLMKKGGTLYISFHFIYPVHNPVEDDCIRHTPRGAVKLLEETGFEIVEHKERVFGCEEGISLGYYSNLMSNEGMRPAKDYHKHHVIGSLIKAIKK